MASPEKKQSKGLRRGDHPADTKGTDMEELSYSRLDDLKTLAQDYFITAGELRRKWQALGGNLGEIDQWIKQQGDAIVQDD